MPRRWQRPAVHGARKSLVSESAGSHQDAARKRSRNCAHRHQSEPPRTQSSPHLSQRLWADGSAAKVPQCRLRALFSFAAQLGRGPPIAAMAISSNAVPPISLNECSRKSQRRRGRRLHAQGTHHGSNATATARKKATSSPRHTSSAYCGRAARRAQRTVTHAEAPPTLTNGDIFLPSS
jgi:hypothetical protein